MTAIRPAGLFLALAFFCLEPQWVMAQTTTPASRGPRTQFEGGEDRESREALIFTASASESYDDNLAAGSTSRPDPRFQEGTFYTQAGAGLFYGRRNDRNKLSAGGNIQLNYYSDSPERTPPSYGGLVDYTILRRRTTVTASVSGSHAPYFQFGAFPGISNPDSALPTDAALAGTQDLGVFSRPTTNYGTGVRWSQTLTRRQSLSMSYGFMGNDLGEGFTNQQNHSAGAQYSYQVGREVSLDASYGFQRLNYQRARNEDALETHELAVGITFLRQLSPTRRVRIRVGTGSWIMERLAPSRLDPVVPPLNGENPVILSEATSYEVGGNFSLFYEFGRSWTAAAEYRRRLEMIEGLSQPYFANGFSSSLAGVVHGLELVGYAGYSQGAEGIEALPRRYNTRTASIRAAWPLSRHFQISGEYIHYNYDFAEIFLPDGVVPQLSRQVVRAGLTFGTALIRHR